MVAFKRQPTKKQSSNKRRQVRSLNKVNNAEHAKQFLNRISEDAWHLCCKECHRKRLEITRRADKLYQRIDRLGELRADDLMKVQATSESLMACYEVD